MARAAVTISTRKRHVEYTPDRFTDEKMGSLSSQYRDVERQGSLLHYYPISVPKMEVQVANLTVPGYRRSGYSRDHGVTWTVSIKL